LVLGGIQRSTTLFGTAFLPLKQLSRDLGSLSLPRSSFISLTILSKPFSHEQLVAAVASLVKAPATVHRLRK